MTEPVSVIMLTIIVCLLLYIAHLQSRRIDRVHERISLTTKLNGLKDPWRDQENSARVQPEKR